MASCGDKERLGFGARMIGQGKNCFFYHVVEDRGGSSRIFSLCSCFSWKRKYNWVTVYLSEVWNLVGIDCALDVVHDLRSPMTSSMYVLYQLTRSTGPAHESGVT